MARENFMVRINLCTERVDEESILRRSLFKTRCKMERKCCKVIINSGSLANVALEELVTKF